MDALICGIALLAVAFTLHVIAWRIRLPQNHTSALLGIFSLIPLVALVLQIGPTGWAWLHMMLLYVACALSYIIFYSAIEEDSPTLLIISCVIAAGASGCSEEDLVRLFERDNALSRRLDRMKHTRLIYERDATFALTPKGRRMARIFALAARILGLKRGG